MGPLLMGVPNHELQLWPSSPSVTSVCCSLLTAQESWTDPSVRGGLQKKKVSFRLEYVLVVF